MSELYPKKRKMQNATTINSPNKPSYYSRRRRIISTQTYYSDSLKRCEDEVARLEPQQDTGVNYRITSQLGSIHEELRILNKRMLLLENQPQPIEEKQLPITEARKIVEAFLKEHFKKNKSIYPSDVADALALPYSTVLEVIEAMEKEKKLK
jgi:hypothetical protein